jgi:hypothetical protein
MGSSKFSIFLSKFDEHLKVRTVFLRRSTKHINLPFFNKKETGFVDLFNVQKH